MKKNKMMRLASSLLVAVLLTSSVISGTFAKYVTSGNANDTARVAKWGVTVVADGKLFDNTYKAGTDLGEPGNGNEDTDDIVLTVESNTEKVVAPGTKNSEGLSFAVKGTPEVDVNVTVAVTNLKEVFLNKTGLPDMTTGLETDVFDVIDYYPVKFTLTQTLENGTKNTLVNKGRLTEVSTELLKFNSKRYDAGTNLGNQIGTLTLTWEWAFDGNDKADTLLGNLAVPGFDLVPATSLAENNDYSINTSLNVTVTVTQID